MSGTDIVRPCGPAQGAADAAPVVRAVDPARHRGRAGLRRRRRHPRWARPITVGRVRRARLRCRCSSTTGRPATSRPGSTSRSGPYLGKSFATSISPWVVPLLALEAARVDTPVQDPKPLPYLRGAEQWGLDIDLEVAWNGHVVSPSAVRADVLVAGADAGPHSPSTAPPPRTGDLFASGTISGPEKDQRGAFIELTWGGPEPVDVGGEQRTFLEDGDEIVITATAPGPDGAGSGSARPAAASPRPGSRRASGCARCGSAGRGGVLRGGSVPSQSRCAVRQSKTVKPHGSASASRASRGRSGLQYHEVGTLSP